MTDVDQLYGGFYALDSHEIALEVTRAKVEEGKTFSKEAMELLNQEIFIFIGARLCKEWETTGNIPQRLRAIITLQFDQTGADK